MRFWLLLVSQAGGSVHEVLSIYAAPGNQETSLSGLKIEAIGINGDDEGELAASARRGGVVALGLLMAEFRSRWDRSLLTLDLDIERPLSHRDVQGRSGDLLFAIALFCQVVQDMQLVEAWPVDLHVAATGALDMFGNVGPVDGVADKLQAALRRGMPRGSYFVYPAHCREQIDDALAARARSSGVELMEVRRFDEALKRIGIEIRGSWDGSPYLGLRPFAPQHSPIFFGRLRETAEFSALLDRREAEGRPGALVVGPSGIGKTSFVLAGWLHRQAGATRGRVLQHAIWRPNEVLAERGSAQPVTEADLARGVLASWARRSRPGDPPDLPRQSGFDGFEALAGMRRASSLNELAEAMRHLDRADTLRVWVIDQFEELFTLERFGESLRQALGDFLLKLQAAGVWIIGTQRLRPHASTTDGDDPSVAAVGRVFDGGVYELGRVTDEALRQIITEPAALAQATFEVHDGVPLSDLLLLEAVRTPDPLPLLEYALELLFADAIRRRPAESAVDWRPQMTHADYQRIKGLRGAIGVVASQTFERMPPDVQDSLPAVLFALAKPVEDGETAVPADLVRWLPGSPGRRLIEALVNEARVLVIADNAGGLPMQLRVAHEALFSHWSDAASILKGKHPVRLRLSEWNQRATQWERSGRRNGWLSRQEERDIETCLQELALSAPDYPLLAQLNQASARRRRRQSVGGAAVAAALLATVSGSLWWYVSRDASLQIDRATSGAKRIEAGNRFLTAAEASQSAAQFADDEARYQNLIAANHLAQSPATERALGSALFESKRLARLLRVDGRVSALAVTADGGRAVYSDEKGALHALHLPSLDPVRQPVALAFGPARHLAFAQSGRSLVAWTADGQIVVLDGATLSPRQVLRQASPDDKVVALATDPGGDAVVVGTGGGTLETWSLGTFSRMATRASKLAPGSGVVGASLALSRDAAIVAKVDDGGRLGLFRTSTLEPIGDLSVADGQAIDAVAFAPEGRTLAVAGEDRVVTLIGLSPLRIIKRSAALHLDTIFKLAYEHDGLSLTTGGADGRIQSWDARSLEPAGEPMSSRVGRIDAMVGLPGLGGLLTASQDGQLRLWRAARVLSGGWDIDAGKGGTAGGMSPDGLVAASGNDRGDLHIWRTDRAEHCDIPSGHAAATNSVAFGPHIGEGAYLLATGSDDRSVRFWNSNTCRPVGVALTASAGFVTAVTFSPDQHLLAAAGFDKTVRVWRRTASGEFVAEGEPLRGHRSPVLSLGISPKGDLLASGGGDKTLRLWNLVNSSVAPKVVELAGPVTSIAFSADGKRLMAGSADGQVMSIDVSAGLAKPSGIRDADQTEMRSISMDTSGRYLVTASGSGRVMLWNLDGDKPVGTPLIERGGRGVAAISSDARLIIGVSADKTWTLPGPKIWKEQACARLVRRMEPSIWPAYGVPDPCNN